MNVTTMSVLDTDTCQTLNTSLIGSVDHTAEIII